MPKCRLTDRNVKAGAVTARDKAGKERAYRLPPKTGTLELWDDLCPGLALRVHAGGKRSYCVTTRIGGKQIRRTIGAVAEFTGIGDVRKAARAVIEDAAAGNDSASKAARRETAAHTEGDSFRAVAGRWLKDTGKNGGGTLRSRGHVRASLERLVFPHWGDRHIGDITQDDVFDLLDDIAETRPYAANRTWSNVRRVFHWAAMRSRRLITASPAEGVERPAEETDRDRVLTAAEIKLLWPRFNRLGFPFGPALKLLLLTGQRLSEVGGMRWPELELDSAAPQWLIPGARTKNKKDHIVPLAPAVCDLIDGLPRIVGCEHVFVSGRAHTRDENGVRQIDRPVSGWGTPKARIDKMLADAETPIENWRFHDFRRTLVTGMNEELNIEPHVVEAAINHVSGLAKAGVAGIYNRALYLEQRRLALTAWALHIETLIGGKAPPSNVANLDEARKRA